MQKINEDKLAEVSINLDHKGSLNESFLTMLGAGVEAILKRMFGVGAPDVSVSGTEPQIQTFVGALRGEKRYIDAIMKHGLDDPKTFASRYKLEDAVKKFESDTGIKWPIS